MNIDVKVPTLPDSIHTADIAKLYVSKANSFMPVMCYLMLKLKRLF